MSDHACPLDKPPAPAPSQWHPIFTQYKSTLQWSVWPYMIQLLVIYPIFFFTTLPLNSFSPPTLSSWLFLKHSTYTPIIQVLHLFLLPGIFFPWAAPWLPYLLQAIHSTFLPSFKIVSCTWAVIWHSLIYFPCFIFLHGYITAFNILHKVPSYFVYSSWNISSWRKGVPDTN